MENSEPVIPEIIRSNVLVIVLALGGIAFLAYGAFQLLAPKEGGVVIEKSFGTAQDKAISSPRVSSISNKDIVVDVEGAVEKPGIYHLPLDARQQDALVAAGGMSKLADRQLVAKTLNMAAKLSDGMKLYIPRIGESVGVVSGASGPGVAGAMTSAISVNSATTAELDGLPGIGAVTANRIITNRPYGSLDELITKKAIGRSVFEKIKDKISL